MRRFLVRVAVLALLWPAALGCSNCDLLRCGSGSCAKEGVADGGSESMPPAMGHVAYPYYTLRSPRDFLYAP